MMLYSGIRIIGGKWKGRRVLVARAVRPTINCMRETLFNWLYAVMPNAVCLDCFAGSGALGLEALSRGALRVTFLENNVICFKMLLQTMRSFKAIYDSEVIYTDSLFWIKESNKIYNVVFIDPPFNKKDIISEFVFLLEKHNHLRKKSWIYIETSKHQNILNTIFIPCRWILYRKKITKNVVYHLYLRNI